MVMLNYDEPSILLVSSVILEYVAYALVVVLFPWSYYLFSDSIRRKIAVSLTAVIFTLLYVTSLATVEWLEFGRSYSYWNGIKFSFFHIPYVLMAYLVIATIAHHMDKFNSWSSKYAYIKIDESESLEIYQKVKDVLVTKELFLMHNLKLADLSQELGQSINKVSRAINENTDGSFSDLLNGLRVKYSQKLLSDPYNDDKLFTIAQDSGFNNKASFHIHFKQSVGMSPARIQSKNEGE